MQFNGQLESDEEWYRSVPFLSVCASGQGRLLPAYTFVVNF